MGLGKIERKQRIDSVRVTDTELVTLTTEGIEVQVADNAPWVISHRTLIDLANKELLEELKAGATINGKQLKLAGIHAPKTKALDMKRLCKVVGIGIGNKGPLTPGTIHKYLKATGTSHIKKEGHRLFFADGTDEKLIAHGRSVQDNKSKMASARYDKTTRRLGRKQIPA
jgi:hypothetical protein